MFKPKWTSTWMFFCVLVLIKLQQINAYENTPHNAALACYDPYGRPQVIINT